MRSTNSCATLPAIARLFDRLAAIAFVAKRAKKAAARPVESSSIYIIERIALVVPTPAQFSNHADSRQARYPVHPNMAATAEKKQKTGLDQAKQARAPELARLRSGPQGWGCGVTRRRRLNRQPPLRPPPRAPAPSCSLQEFLKVFERLRDELVDDELLAGQPDASKEWARKMLDYNVPLGKLNRGMAVLDVVKACAGEGATLSEAETFRAQALGWQPHVGMVAINDGILLDAMIYRILRRHFGELPAYVHLLDLFHEVTYQTAHGQLLDTTTAPIGTVDLSRYTLSTYMRIVTYKTAYYTFYLPVACGLRLAGVTDAAAYKLAEETCVAMGQYFQIQDDYLDCFGDPEVIGKVERELMLRGVESRVGTDIEDNKCSWLVVQALERASEQQRKVIEEHYGKSDEASVAAVKGVYRELDLEGLFKTYEQESYDGLVSRIQSQDLLPQEVFMMLLRKIYKRQKLASGVPHCALGTSIERSSHLSQAAAAPRAALQVEQQVRVATNGSDEFLAADMSKTVLGIILGGGAGSRLYPLTKKRAKPAVPLGANYRLIDIPVSNCINRRAGRRGRKRGGVNKIYCLTQFNSASLNRHLAQAYNSNVGGYNSRGFVEVLAASQTTTTKTWFQGTADAVRQYLWLFEEACRDGVEDYLILSGDHLYRMDYREFVMAHRAAGADITVAALPCEEAQAQAFGLMKIDNTGRIREFAEKPKGDALKAMQVDTRVLGLDAATAKLKPYIASMGIYVCKASALHELLTTHFEGKNDFGNDIIPGANDIGMKIQARWMRMAVHGCAHLFDGYWEDIGTVRAFYDANLGLTDSPTPAFSFYDKHAPIYTMSRFLPPSKVMGAGALGALGCGVVVGLRARIRENSVIEDTLLMGSDYYEQPEECNVELDCLPLGVGRGTHIRGAIVDKNARIGKFCKILNEDNGYVIRDGIVVIIKDSVIPDGTVI
eukprot:scaffold9.g3158.t1